MDVVSLLSMSTTGLCLFLKLPQILSVIQSSSVEGLSRSSLMLEFFSYSSTLSYSMYFGYPFKMYSEYPPLLLQDLILFLLIMRSDRGGLESEQQALINKKKHDSNTMNGKKNGIMSRINILKIFIPVNIAFHTMIALRLFPRFIPILSISISSPIGVISKFLQLWEIVSKKSAGSVSAVSWFLNFVSTICRLISVLMTVKDVTIIISLAACAILNIAVSIVALYYSPSRIVQSNMNGVEKDTKNNNVLQEKNGVVENKKNK